MKTIWTTRPLAHSIALVCWTVGVLSGISAREPLREYDVLRSFPPGRLAALSVNDEPNEKGLTGTNRSFGSWLEAGPQRGSCRGVVAAVAAGDLALADRCWRGIEVAFAHQKPDGSFEAELRPNGESARPYGAAVETAYFFLQELGRAVLVIRQSPHEAHFHDRLVAIEPKMRRACEFILGGYDTIPARSAKAVNRIFIAAKAFGLCGKALREPRYLEACRTLVKLGLTLRDGEGVFIEHGGRDSSYNVVSILIGQILALHVELPELEDSFHAAVRWQLTKILPSGEIDVTDNTRTGVGKEKSYTGQPKNVNTNEIIYALTLYGVVHHHPEALAAAARVAQFYQKN